MSQTFILWRDNCIVCMIEYERIRNNIENWKKNAGKCGLVKIMQKVRSVYKNEVNSKINKICRAIESLQKNGIECSVFICMIMTF